MAGGDQVEFLVGQHVAVHVVDVGAEQPAAFQGGHGAGRAGHAHVHGDREAEVAGEREVLGVAFLAGEARPEQCHAHLQPQVGSRGELFAAHPASVRGVRRVRIVGGRPGTAVEEVAPDAGLLKAAQVSIGVGGGLEVVRPVGDRGDPGVQRLQGAPQGSGVDVICGVLGGDPGQHSGPVARPGDLGGEPENGPLPYVAVGVDEARDDEPAFGVDHLGVAG